MASRLYANGGTVGPVPIATLYTLFPPATCVNAQAWVIGTDLQLFKAICDGVTWFRVSDRQPISSTPAIQYKMATVWNPIFNANDSDSNNLYGYLTETPHRFSGYNVNVISMFFLNWYLSNLSTGELNNVGNTQPIQEVSFELNGVSVPVLFNGGRAITLLDGASNIRPDDLLTSQFGVANAAGMTGYLRIRIRYAAPSSVPYSQRNPSQGNRTKMWRYDPAVTFPSSIDVAGEITYTGPAPVTRGGGYYAFIIGKHVDANAKAIVVAPGTSIENAVGDGNSLVTGSGWVQRAIMQMAVPPGCLNLAVSGSKALAGSADSRLTDLYQYCKSAVIIGANTNDINPQGTLTTAAQMKDQTDFRAGQARAAGIAKVIVSPLIAYTTSTNNWTTSVQADQTAISSAWGAGGIASQYNALLPSGGYDLVTTHNALRTVGTFNYWNANMTADGLHPTQAGHIADATENYAAMQVVI